MERLDDFDCGNCGLYGFGALRGVYFGRFLNLWGVNEMQWKILITQHFSKNGVRTKTLSGGSAKNWDDARKNAKSELDVWKAAYRDENVRLEIWFCETDI